MSTDTPAGLIFVEAPPAPETFNVLLYGQPKSGKSTAAATAPGPILWVNAEGRGALGFARKTAAQRGNTIHEITIDKFSAAQRLEAVYTHVRDGSEPRVATVVVDTIGKVRDALVDQFVVKNSSQSLKQYGVVADKLGGFINAMRDLPVNLILLAHADIQNSEEDGRIVLPLIGGKLTETVPGEVDVVAFTSPLKHGDDPIRYYGQLVEGRGRIAGDRSGGLANDQGIRELDLSEWLNAYRAALSTGDVPWDGDPAEPTPDEIEEAGQQTLEAVKA